MDNIPSPLSEMLEELDSLDRVERAQYLLELSDDFQEVPETIATRPFPENRRVPKCESEAFVWAQDQDDGTLKFHYAVETLWVFRHEPWARFSTKRCQANHWIESRTFHLISFTPSLVASFQWARAKD